MVKLDDVIFKKSSILSCVVLYYFFVFSRGVSKIGDSKSSIDPPKSISPLIRWTNRFQYYYRIVMYFTPIMEVGEDAASSLVWFYYLAYFIIY